MSMTMDENIKRWTAKRKAALIIVPGNVFQTFLDTSDKKLVRQAL